MLGADAAAGIFGCSSDSVSWCMSDSLYAKASASDEVDETSDSGPSFDAEWSTVWMLVLW